MAKSYPSDVLQQAQMILAAWNQIGATVTLGAQTVATFTADVTAAGTIDTDIAKLEAQLIDKRNQRDATNTALWDKVKRVRNGVKANYGDDSSQYEMVGGTRTSERKTAARKAVAA